MSLYISNATKQDWTFWYRMPGDKPEDRLLQRVSIQSGHGDVIGEKWGVHVKAHVIAQLERAGARDAAEAHGRMSGRFGGLLYRDNGEISTDEIQTGHEHIVGQQEERSVVQASRAAMGFDRSLNGGKRGQRAVKTSSIEVIQDIPPHTRPTGNEVHFGVTVDPDGRQDIRLAS